MKTISAEKVPNALSEESPIITGLHDDYIRAYSHGQNIFIDAGRNAEVSEAGFPLRSLTVNISNDHDPLSQYERLHIDSAGGRIELSDKVNPGSTISVDGVVIGSISSSSDQWAMSIDFNDDASPGAVQELIRSLVYINEAEDYPLTVSTIGVRILPKSGPEESSFVKITTASEDKIVLTPETDVLQGTEGRDIFYAPTFHLDETDELDGGEGEDTLVLFRSSFEFDISNLAKFVSIENIQGTKIDDIINIRADQLNDVRRIAGVGGLDILRIYGNEIDLRQIDIVGITKIDLNDDDTVITLDDVETAKHVWAYDTQGETLILTTGVLSDAERRAIHRRGIDTIVTQQDGVTTTHNAPEVTNLDGDRVTLSAGGTVFIDEGQDAQISCDEENLDALAVKITSGSDIEDRLEIDTSGRISLSDGYAFDSRVSVGGTEIGSIESITHASLDIRFNRDATPDLVQELLNAWIFTNMNGPIITPRVIEIALTDAAGRDSTSKVIVDPVGWTAVEVIEGAGAGALVGTLAAEDTEGNDLTYVLTGTSADLFELESAEGGYAVRVKEGVVLDYENATHRRFTVLVSDDNGTVEKTFGLIIENLDESATAVFTATSVHEGAGGGTVVGTIVPTDPDNVFPAWCELSAGSEELFELSDNGNHGFIVRVKDGVILDYENLTHRSFTVIATDFSAPDVTLTFNLDLTNTNDNPSLSFNAAKIIEGASGGTVIGTLTGQDPEGLPLQYALSGASANLFELRAKSSGYDVVVKNGIVLDYENLAHRSLNIRVSDGANTVENTFTLDLDNRNESPIATFTAVTVKEGSAGGTTIGTLSAADPEGSALSYALTGTSADLFELMPDVGGGYRLVVKQGMTLDYENSVHHSISVLISDGDNTTRKSFTLSMMDEIDLVSGTARNDILTGQSGSDILKGLAGRDTLDGTSGNDKIYGGLGNDSLKGGSGHDIFVFDTRPAKASNKDRIVDFSLKNDSIWLDNAIFSKLGAGTENRPMQLKKEYFVVGEKAQDRNDYIIYDKKKGVLLYDSDGSGRGRAVEIASLSKNLKMTHKDFFVI